LEDSSQTEVFALDARTGSRRQLTTNEVVESRVGISPDGQTISFVCGCNAKYENYYASQIFIAAFDSGTPRPLLNKFEHDVVNTTWVSAKEIYFTANMGVHDEIFSAMVPDGTTKILTDGKKQNTITT